MFVTKKALPRRTFLQGMGVTLALPFLEAMVPATKASAASKQPLRFGVMYLPQGLIMDRWTPTDVGTDFEIPSIMKPLEPFRDQMVVVSGLDGAPNGGTGTHATGPASFLNGAVPKRTEGNDIHAGVTLDQLIAKQIGQDTPYPSLELATEDFSGAVGGCERGYSCLYMNTISWSSATTPLPMEINPHVVFERLFGGSGTLDERLAQRNRNRSILDAVLVEAARLQAGLGGPDRARVNEYLDTVREIERRIQKADEATDASVQAPELPPGIPENFGEHMALLFDLLHVAYQADLTRVASVMMARELHGRSYPELGVPEGHHSLSHHGFKAEAMAKYAIVNTYHTSLFANFLKKMRETPDGDGNLLDHSLLLFGSGMSWSTDHDERGLPNAVIGGANGAMRGGRHIASPKGTPHANLLVALGQKAGVSIETFGRSTGKVEL